MSDLAFTIASKTFPLFKFGMPHERNTLIPLTFSSHFVMFDIELKRAAWAMLEINCTNSDKLVERDDDFVSDHTLPDELRVTNKDYAEWNKANPEHPYDKGHVCGSQLRRGNPVVQHDIDNLAGVIAETPALNRMVKNPLECDIVERVAQDDVIRAYYVAGPSGVVAEFPCGMTIPRWSWISVAMETHSRVKIHSWVMKNVQDKDLVDLQQVPLDDLERYTGLALWTELPNISRDTITEWDG